MKLLKHDGVVALKSLCFQNLHLEAHSADENSLLAEFLDDAQQVSRVLALNSCVNVLGLCHPTHTSYTFRPFPGILER